MCRWICLGHWSTGSSNSASAKGSTLYMLFLAGFFGLLHRLTQQRDLVIGTPIANRNRLEIEDLIGTFVNTLVLRTDVTQRPDLP